MKKRRSFSGFTLIELLIVIMLLGFLSITGLSLYQGSQKRARDSRRKSDLYQIAKALEMYANDSGYPAATSGKITGCDGASACEWGAAWFKTVGSARVVYMQKLPKDPGSESYCYQTVLSGYKLFAKLEGDDADRLATPVSCNNQSIYNYVLRSSNLLPTQ